MTIILCTTLVECQTCYSCPHHIPSSIMVTTAVLGVSNIPPFGFCTKTLKASVPSRSESSNSMMFLHIISPVLLVIGNDRVSGNVELVSAESGKQQNS